MKKFFLLLSVIVVCYSCAAFAPKDKRCVVEGYELKKYGNAEIALKFIDNSACTYQLAADTERSWIIYTPGAYFGTDIPSIDNFSISYINTIRRSEAGIEIYFNASFEARRKGIESDGEFLFKKIDTPPPGKEGGVITSLWCNINPFLMRVDNDGAVRYSVNIVDGDRSYLDVFGVVLADNFSIPKDCSFVERASQLDFPKRVRFIVANAALPYLQVYGDGSSIFLEETLDTKIVKGSYILSVTEETVPPVQTIYVNATEGMKPKIETVNAEGVKINLGGRFNSVAKVGKDVYLTGDAFSSLNISRNGDMINLNSRANSNIEVRLEKAEHGFVIYAKVLK